MSQRLKMLIEGTWEIVKPALQSYLDKAIKFINAMGTGKET